MLIEQATVLECNNNKALIECYAKSGCSGCSSKNSCGTQSLSELTGNKNQILLEIEVNQELKQGDIIQIGLKETTFLTGVIWLYGLPLLVLILVAVGFSQIFTNELIVALCSLMMTLSSFRLIKQKFDRQNNYHVTFLGKI
ncbi:MAG: SoxR reducing system RseC family protein [Pasteurella sp.]|nr:SoxR reducing system RseC family protein [Pasteurella sp.]